MTNSVKKTGPKPAKERTNRAASKTSARRLPNGAGKRTPTVPVGVLARRPRTITPYENWSSAAPRHSPRLPLARAFRMANLQIYRGSTNCR